MTERKQKHYGSNIDVREVLEAYIKSPECKHPGGSMLAVVAHFQILLSRMPNSVRHQITREDLEEVCRFYADFITSVSKRQPVRAHDLAEKLGIPVGENIWVGFMDWIEQRINNEPADDPITIPPFLKRSK